MGVIREDFCGSGCSKNALFVFFICNYTCRTDNLELKRKQRMIVMHLIDQNKKKDERVPTCTCSMQHVCVCGGGGGGGGRARVCTWD